MPAKKYAITFTTGLEGPVAELLAKGGGQQVRVGGAFATFLKAGKPETPFAAQLFAVLEEGRAASGREWLMSLVRKTGWTSRLAGMNTGAQTFRVIVSEGGRLQSAPDKSLTRMEEIVTQATGMLPDRARPGVELWAMVRQNGEAYLLLRLSRVSAAERELPPGALRPDFCALLAALSGAGKGSAAIDPFAGHGGIARALAARGANVHCGDSDPRLAQELIAWARRTRGAAAERWDALALPMEAGTCDVAVTDPPWGDFAPLPMPPQEFMSAVARELARVLKPAACAVVVTSLSRQAEAAFQAQGFAVQSHDVLVNGKKAGVVVARRGFQKQRGHDTINSGDAARGAGEQ